MDPSRLLVFEASQGWGPLCTFLGKPIPDEPYPQRNTSEEFVAQESEDDVEIPT